MSQASLRQWAERTRKERFVDACQRLELELRMGTARRHLDTLLDLADTLLESITGTNDGWMSDARIHLSGLKRQVNERGVGAANDVRRS